MTTKSAKAIFGFWGFRAQEPGRGAPRNPGGPVPRRNPGPPKPGTSHPLLWNTVRILLGSQLGKKGTSETAMMPNNSGFLSRANFGDEEATPRNSIPEELFLWLCAISVVRLLLFPRPTIMPLSIQTHANLSFLEFPRSESYHPC